MKPREDESPHVVSPDGVVAALSEFERDDDEVAAATAASAADDKKDVAATSEPPRSAKPAASLQPQSPTGTLLRTGALYVAAVVLLALLCLGWTLWLMILTASPTKTVNNLMATSTLDFGAFWRLSESPSAVVGVGLAGLACVVLGYVAVLIQIVFDLVVRGKRRDTASRTTSSSRYSAKVSGYLAAVHAAQERKGPRSSAQNQRVSRHWSADFKRRASQLALDVLDRESKTRRNMYSLIKIADIAIQCVFLGQLMEARVPVALIGVFAASVALNALGAAVMFAMPRDNMGRAQLLVDTASDFVIATAFPVVVLAYALSSFTFDQTLMAINAQTFPPAFFERMAAVVADPVEVATVRRTLDSLRIDSVLKIFTRVGTSAALCRRFFGLAELLRVHHAGLVAFPNVYPKRHRPLAAFFFAVAVAVVVVTTESVRSSSAACAMHPECVQIARRWIVGRDHDDATRCPCLAMIDGNTAIATYAEWDKPLDRTEKLAQLAATGDLQLLQLVNRALPAFPEELRRCTNLQHVSLYYTETLVVPDWFAELTQLEFFHVEGKSLDKSFHTLPDGLFDNMQKLTYLHFGSQALPKLPSLEGLTDLRTFTLGALFFLTELPSFDRLHHLERLTVAGVPLVESFPDLTHVRAPQSLATADRGSFCCNGFLGPDKCDLTRSLCQPHLLGAPAVTQCLPADRVASAATRAYFDKFASSACSGEAGRPGEFKLSPTPEEMAQCNGTLYRACEPPGAAPGTEAMCYNARWMAVACDPSPFPIAMRRRQIALGRGEPCDPVNEAWLGCR